VRVAESLYRHPGTLAGLSTSLLVANVQAELHASRTADQCQESGRKLTNERFRCSNV
jgi:hypothetical protein